VCKQTLSVNRRKMIKYKYKKQTLYGFYFVKSDCIYFYAFFLSVYYILFPQDQTMGATLSQCTCLDTWLLSNQSTLQEKINTLEANHIVLQTNYASLETDFTVFKKDTTKKLEALEKKSNGMFFVQEESDPDLIVLHKGK
jgi:hypothetical protein